MKTAILISAIVACALAAPLASADDNMPAPGGPAMNRDMDMSRLQVKMKAMQAQMDRIHRTRDANERQKLLQQHMQAMQENMQMMRGMGGPMMKGAGEHGGMTEGDMNKRHDMMEQRADMMQIMMEQMIERDQVMESMPHK